MTIDDYITVQALQGEPVRHPAWPHAHLAWIPLYLTEEAGVSVEHQTQVFRTRAMAACQGTSLEQPAIMWDRPWVLSLPLGPDRGGDPGAVEER